MITLEITCPLCGEIYYVNVTEESWDAYTNGMLAQNAFPYLNIIEREAIISNLCPACQAKIFKQPEEA